MCFAFLWLGFEFKLIGVKVVWTDVCTVKSEGGLGIRVFKEVNKVYGLKLIWRMFSDELLWGKWIRVNLLKKKIFWKVNMKT